MFCTNQIRDLTRSPLQLHQETHMNNWACISVFLYFCTVCLCFIYLWLSSSGQLAHSCSYHSQSWSPFFFFFGETCWYVCHIIRRSYLEFWSQEKMNIMSWCPWDAPNSELQHPNSLFKVYLAERFVSFPARVFS